MRGRRVRGEPGCGGSRASCPRAEPNAVLVRRPFVVRSRQDSSSVRSRDDGPQAHTAGTGRSGRVTPPASRALPTTGQLRMRTDSASAPQTGVWRCPDAETIAAPKGCPEPSFSARFGVACGAGAWESLPKDPAKPQVIPEGAG